VPDADDTSGALLALAALDQEYEPEVLNAARMGIKWLIALQNRDGGIPTFCKGWGRLPFDRSCPDITAHALRAWNQWLPHQPPEYATSMLQAIDDAIEFLLRSQDPSGSWVPLWFGCQHSEDQTNPTYGTSRVLFALETINQDSPAMQEAIAKARKWLQNAQLPDGSWGGGPGAPGTVEETGLAVTALAAGEPCPALGKGLAWLVQNLDRAIHPQPAPIGLYFAKLWYSEQAYPLIFATEAVGNALQMANAIEG
jgi:squalene-hopene/tetraprenyl-beta-curcumene cyclase